MSIGREYYDSEGNYWQIETPHYIPPEEAIKNPADRKREEDFKKEARRINKVLTAACIVAMAFLFIVLMVKGA